MLSISCLISVKAFFRIALRLPSFSKAFRKDWCEDLGFRIDYGLDLITALCGLYGLFYWLKPEPENLTFPIAVKFFSTVLAPLLSFELIKAIVFFLEILERRCLVSLDPRFNLLCSVQLDFDWLMCVVDEPLDILLMLPLRMLCLIRLVDGF